MRNSEQARLADDIRLANEEYAVKASALAQEIAGLDKSSKEYENKLRALNDRKLELTRAHEDQLMQIQVKAEEDRNNRILSAERRRDDMIASGLTNVLMRHETFSKMMLSIGDQIAAGMMQTAIKSILADDMTKEHDAAAAARKAYLAGMQFPFPANIIMGPALGAMAFASVMAFEGGGMVPGVGNGDIVPARLEPGEGVLTKRQMEGVINQAKFGNGDNSGGDVHIHHHQTNHIHAIDGASVRGMLEKHGDEFARHANNHIRKMNK